MLRAFLTFIILKADRCQMLEDKFIEIPCTHQSEIGQIMIYFFLNLHSSKQ